MIAEIIPYTKLPRNLDIFDYKITDELAKECPIGQIVFIPFRNQTILGVIKKYKDKSEFPRLKKITEKTEYKLTKKQVDLIYDLANYYINSPSLILKEILPAIPKKKHEVKIKWTDIYNWQYDKNAVNTLENTNNLKKEITNEFNRYLILSNKQKRRWSLYWNYLTRYIKHGKKQLMIIFPNIQDIEAFLKFIPTDYENYISILTSKIHQKKNLYFNEWLKIKNNKIKVILGTRSAIFSPLENIETLIIDQAEARDYKQDEPNPRYHCVDVAYLSQKRYNFRLILNSLNPRFLDYFLSKEKDDYQIINDYQIIKDKSHWINMKDEIYNPDKHPILSEKVENLIKEKIPKGENVLILHNKKGFAKQIQCKSCQHIFTCPSCKSPYQYNQKENSLHCNNCKKTERFLYCPKCHSKEWSLFSYGIGHLSKYWTEKNFSNKNIEYKNYSAQKIEEIKEKLKNIKKGQLFIATNFIFRLVDINYFDHIIITNTDRLLYSNDFNANWHTFNQYNELIQKAAENNISIYLQSYNIDHFIFQSLKRHKYHEFYKNELKWRKNLNYPPFKQLIKLIYQNENANEGEKIVKIHYQKLQNEFKGNLRISFPYPIYKSLIKRKNKTTYRWIIAIRTKYENLKPQANLYKFLEKLNTDWLIDINPENLYK